MAAQTCAFASRASIARPRLALPASRRQHARQISAPVRAKLSGPKPSSNTPNIFAVSAPDRDSIATEICLSTRLPLTMRARPRPPQCRQLRQWSLCRACTRAFFTGGLGPWLSTNQSTCLRSTYTSVTKAEHAPTLIRERAWDAFWAFEKWFIPASVKKVWHQEHGHSTSRPWGADRAERRHLQRPGCNSVHQLLREPRAGPLDSPLHHRGVSSGSTGASYSFQGSHIEFKAGCQSAGLLCVTLRVCSGPKQKRQEKSIAYPGRGS